MNVGSLFSGIGGFDLGLERAGFRTVWFCEQDEFCQRVLAKHWPGVPCYPDVCALSGADVEPVDVLCGGFPCQDLSVAGRGAGLDGARSGLWSEYARIVRELRPRYVIVENVPGLLARGMGRVLGELAEIGYDAEWDCIPASAVGAPHQRDRLWVVAYPGSDGVRIESEWDQRQGRGIREAVSGDAIAEHDGAAGRLDGWGSRPWAVEPDVGRVVDGLPGRVDRLRALGNSLVPQIAEWLGRRILEHERGRLDAAA